MSLGRFLLQHHRLQRVSINSQRAEFCFIDAGFHRQSLDLIVQAVAYYFGNGGRVSGAVADAPSEVSRRQPVRVDAVEFGFDPIEGVVFFLEIQLKDRGNGGGGMLFHGGIDRVGIE